MPYKDLADQRKAQTRFRKRHLALGLCLACTEPVDPGNKSWCTFHRRMQAESKRRTRTNRMEKANDPSGGSQHARWPDAEPAVG